VPQDLVFWKDVGEALESFATALALILGGLWTYLAFFRQRLSLPRLDVTVAVQEASMAKCVLVRAQVSLRNSGSVIVRSNRGEIRLRQVIPPPSEIEEAVASGLDPVPSDCAQIEWPMLAGRQWNWKKGEFEIEPGEADSLCADFFVPLKTQVIELYFFLANARKTGQNIGWTVSHIYHLSNQGGKSGKEGYVEQATTPGGAAAADSRTADTEATTAPTSGQDKEVVAGRVTPASTGRPASPSAR
jgi:hypothetical protein